MTDFPSTIQTSDWRLFREKPKKRQIKTTFESGHVQSRAGATQMKREFTIGWPSMSRTDYDSLVTFFESYQGTVFNFTHPITSVVYSVRFMENELPEAEPIGTAYVKLDGLKLEEA